MLLLLMVVIVVLVMLAVVQVVVEFAKDRLVVAQVVAIADAESTAGG